MKNSCRPSSEDMEQAKKGVHVHVLAVLALKYTFIQFSSIFKCNRWFDIKCVLFQKILTKCILT